MKGRERGERNKREKKKEKNKNSSKKQSKRKPRQGDWETDTSLYIYTYIVRERKIDKYEMGIKRYEKFDGEIIIFVFDYREKSSTGIRV